MRRYETLYITDRDKEMIEEINSRVKEIVEQNRGEFLKDEDWGDRQMAYPIGKKQRGKYIRLVYELAPDQIGDVNRVLKFQEGVIRFQTYVLKGEGPAVPYEPPDEFRSGREVHSPEPGDDSKKEETETENKPVSEEEPEAGKEPAEGDAERSSGEVS